MQFQFFAARSDFERVFAIVFGEELRAFEAYSRYDERLREFRNIDEILEAYPRFTDHPGTPHLMLWAPGTCKLERKRIKLDAGVGGKFRYAAEGVCLIGLLLGDAKGKVVTPSWIAHNSAARAARWGAQEGDADFEKVAQITGRMKRAITKLAAAKCYVPGKTRGGDLVLPGALRLARKGYALRSFAATTWSYEIAR